MTLTDQQIRDLWKQAVPFPGWDDWRTKYLRSVRSVQSKTVVQLGTDDGQNTIWEADGLGGIGPGSAVVIPDAARRDPMIAPALAALRGKTWPADARERAKAISQEYQRLLDLLAKKHTKKRPQARLLRAFAALIPGELHCGFNSESQRNIAELLVTNWRDHEVVEQHVLARARLRGVLGPEANDEEHVLRSVFCWWLHENREAIEKGTAPADRAPATNAESRPVSVLPFHKQFKGNFAISRMTASYRDVVQTCLPGTPREDLVESLGAIPEFQQLSKASRKQLVSRVAGLGLIAQGGDGLLRATGDGEAFLENDLPDVLVEKMIERVYPFAAFLRFAAGGTHTKKDLIGHLRLLYPNWTEDQGPAFLLAWVRDLGLIEKKPTADAFDLTDYGAFWTKRLPDELPEAVPASMITDTDEAVGSVAEEAGPVDRSHWPSVDAILEQFATDEHVATFVFDPLLIRSLHHALHCNSKKRFVILSGLSGTGKTQAMLCYARVFCKLLNLDERIHRRLVAVSPDWQDHTGVVGYLNALHEEPTFQPEPALNLLLAAAEDPSNPYFLILDEMNLARVERYFAPFLSAMETGDDLRLHGEDAAVNGVPPSVSWPTNLFIAGTVNMDETTHGFSDKVLDRAFALEFWDVDLDEFFRRRSHRDPPAEALLLKLNETLFPVRRHFGYRTAGEILNFVAQAGPGASATHRTELLDQAVYAKVLPRIRGEDGKALQTALEKVKTVCTDAALPRSAAKITAMAETLRQVGVTRFWS